MCVHMCVYVLLLCGLWGLTELRLYILVSRVFSCRALPLALAFKMTFHVM